MTYANPRCTRHPPTGSMAVSMTRRSGSSKSTRTPPSMRRTTSRARSPGAGPTTSIIPSDATTSTRTGSAGLLSAAGVGPESTVVLYGGNNNWFAAYAYWLFKLRGVERVQLLDGGRKKWELKAASAIDAGTPGAWLPATFRYRAPGPPRELRVFRWTRCSPGPPPAACLSTCVRRPSSAAGTARAGPLPAGAAARRRSHPRSAERPVVQGRQRRRNVQVRRRTAGARPRRRHPARRRGRHLLPDRERSSYTRVVSSPNCSATPTSATTTAPGPSTARW